MLLRRGGAQEAAYHDNQQSDVNDSGIPIELTRPDPPDRPAGQTAQPQQRDDQSPRRRIGIEQAHILARKQGAHGNQRRGQTEQGSASNSGPRPIGCAGADCVSREVAFLKRLVGVALSGSTPFFRNNHSSFPCRPCLRSLAIRRAVAHCRLAGYDYPQAVQISALPTRPAHIGSGAMQRINGRKKHAAKPTPAPVMKPAESAPRGGLEEFQDWHEYERRLESAHHDEAARVPARRATAAHHLLAAIRSRPARPHRPDHHQDARHRRDAATGLHFLRELLAHKRAMLYFTQASTRTFLSFLNACQILGMQPATRSATRRCRPRPRASRRSIRSACSPATSTSSSCGRSYPHFAEACAYLMNDLDRITRRRPSSASAACRSSTAAPAPTSTPRRPCSTSTPCSESSASSRKRTPRAGRASTSCAANIRNLTRRAWTTRSTASAATSAAAGRCARWPRCCRSTRA